MAYLFPIQVHRVIVQYQVMVFVDPSWDHGPKQAMFPVSKFRNQYHRNNVMVKTHRKALDPMVYFNGYLYINSLDDSLHLEYLME